MKNRCPRVSPDMHHTRQVIRLATMPPCDMRWDSSRRICHAVSPVGSLAAVRHIEMLGTRCRTCAKRCIPSTRLSCCSIKKRSSWALKCCLTISGRLFRADVGGPQLQLEMMNSQRWSQVADLELPSCSQVCTFFAS